MNSRPLSDAQISRALRAHLPSQPQPGLFARISEQVEATPQRRPWPSIFRAFTDADSMGQRRMLLLLAALLLALIVGTIGVVGALLNDRRGIRDLSLDPPTDLTAFVRSAYDQMSALKPLTLTSLEDGTVDGTKKHRIYVDGSGAVRIEHYGSHDAREPERYKIYAGTRTGELTMDATGPTWYEQDDAISEDPRVFVYATLAGAALSPDSGCLVGVDSGDAPGITTFGFPGSGWEYVGLDYVVGRPTHHVKCYGDLWIDVETRLTLRSRGPGTDATGRPVADRFGTVEVTDIRFGQPDPALFEIKPPDDAQRLDETQYELKQCIGSGSCLASPRPVETLPTAQGVEPPADVDELIQRALSATDEIAAYEAIIKDSYTRLVGTTPTRVLSNGAGRYRLERTFQPGTVWESVVISVGDANGGWTSEPEAGGSRTWRKTDHEFGFPLQLPNGCPGGWQHVGVDLVASRPADHVACAGAVVAPDFWIDRETLLVVRIQGAEDPVMGTWVQEVVSFTFVEHPAELFEPPA
jgi:hypothetical protein